MTNNVIERIFRDLKYVWLRKRRNLTVPALIRVLLECVVQSIVLDAEAKAQSRHVTRHQQRDLRSERYASHASTLPMQQAQCQLPHRLGTMAEGAGREVLANGNHGAASGMAPISVSSSSLAAASTVECWGLPSCAAQPSAGDDHAAEAAYCVCLLDGSCSRCGYDGRGGVCRHVLACWQAQSAHIDEARTDHMVQAPSPIPGLPVASGCVLDDPAIQDTLQHAAGPAVTIAHHLADQ